MYLADMVKDVLPMSKKGLKSSASVSAQNGTLVRQSVKEIMMIVTFTIATEAR